MGTLSRALVAFVAAVATFYFMLWVVCTLLLPDSTPWSIRTLVSLAVAIWAGRSIWSRPATGQDGFFRAALHGALVVGGIGFVVGFFGPLIFAPGANQGPLLGIFITGPLGALAGAIGGVVRWKWRSGPGRG